MPAGTGPAGAGPATDVTHRRPRVPRGAVTAGDGLLVVDKPAGVTSHDVVAAVRRLAATRRVGHAGTLDKTCASLLSSLRISDTPMMLLPHWSAPASCKVASFSWYKCKKSYP